MAWEIPGRGNERQGEWRSAGLAPSEVDAALVEESARSFMAKVYRWMFGALTLTAGTAFVVASNEQLLRAVAGLYMPLVIGELVLALVLSFVAPKLRGATAGLLFMAYAFMTGLTFSVLFAIYTGGSLAQAFGVTAGTFGGMSLYATFTKKNLSAWGTFLFMGLIGVVLAGLVQLFVHSPGLTFVVACAGVVVFAGLTAYDTQKLRQLHAQSGYSDANAFAITGAFILYLDFINLFLQLLRLLGRRR